MQLEASHYSATLRVPLLTVNQPKVRFITSDSHVNRRNAHMEIYMENYNKTGNKNSVMEIRSVSVCGANFCDLKTPSITEGLLKKYTSLVETRFWKN
jgi:hypothetical protein